WVAAIMLLLPSALAAFSFVFDPSFLPAAVLTLLAALFSVSVRQTAGDGDAERQRFTPSASIAMPQHRMRVILGIVVALLGGAAAFFLFSVPWGMLLAARAASSIGATLLQRAPLSALAVPAAAWCSKCDQHRLWGRERAAHRPIFWGGMLEFGAILIVIAVI